MKTRGKRGKLRFTPTQRAEITARCARMDREGYSQIEISRQLGISQVTVSKLLKKARVRYAAEAQLDAAYLYAIYRDVLQAAWEGYRKSCENVEKVVTEEGRLLKLLNDKKVPNTKKNLELIKRIKTIEGRVPAAEFLSVIRATMESIAKLFGLNTPEKIDLKASVTTMNWDSVLAQAFGIGAPTDQDRLEEKIRPTHLLENQDAKDPQCGGKEEEADRQTPP